jgi:hypothetical protein
MNYKTILENWKKFTQSTKPLTLTERREIMNEISKHSAEKIYDWMKETDGLAYDFKEIFGDNMRIHFPLDSDDTRAIKGIVKAIREDGWSPPISDSSRTRQRNIYAYEKNVETGDRLNPDGGDWEPTKEEWKAWEASDAPERAFPVKKVKQKRQRLAADGGGEYEEEINVADLNLERSVEMVIPKGPRAGEKIIKVHQQGINKVISGLEKKGKIPAGSAEWWSKKQTYYTKDLNYKSIQRGLRRDDFVEASATSEMHVILSRHPIDVLRMSDISNIHSCHSEGSDYFKCAVAEAKGHGPIAYMVTGEELNKLLKPSEEREAPIAKMDRMFSDMAKGERITAIRQDYDTETPEGALVLLWAWARSNVGRKWMEEYKKKAEMAAKPERHQELMMISQARQLNIGPELFKQYIKNYEKYVARGTGSHPDNWKPWEDITSEEEYKEALEKHAEEATRAPDPRDLGDLDDEEIFRDNDREIPGIGVQARVRLRKYTDHENDLTFTAPESRTYGRSVPGFVDAVNEKVWESQKGMFAQELGDLDTDGKGEATTYFIPDFNNLERFGGTYGDTRDGEILNNLFRIGRGTDLDDPYPDNNDVEQDLDGEEDEENEQLWAEYERAVEDLNEQASNSLEHCDFYAEVGEGGGEHPYVSAGGSLNMIIELGWGDDGEGNDVHATMSIPDDDYGTEGRELRDLLDLPNEYHDQIEFSHGDKGLEISWEFPCEDCNDPDSADYHLDYMKELDNKYDQFYEHIRLKLVEEGYAKANAWDNTTSEIKDFESRLKNFNIIGDDDDDPTGEIWFNLGAGHGNGDPDVPLDLKLDIKKIYWLTKHPNFAYGPTSRRAVSDGPGFLMAKALSGRQERNVVWVGSDTNSSYARFFADNLKKLEAAANNYASTQLDLPFGDKYTAPAFEGVSFAKDTQIGLKFGDAAHREVAEVPIYFRLRIVIRNKDTKEELEGAFHFVEFVDKHVDMIMGAAKDVTRAFALEPNLEIAAEMKEEYLSGNVAMEYSKKIKADYGDPNNPTLAHNDAIVAWWSAGNTYSKMNEFEKEVLIEKYLKPMSTGQVVRWEEAAHLPFGWNRNVTSWMTEAGVAGAIRDKYNSDELKNPEITLKFFGTEEERAKKAADYDLKLAINRYRMSGKDLSDEDRESIRKEIYAAHGLGDTAPLGTNAQIPLEKTEREKVIEELTAAFRGRAPTEEEIEDLLRRRKERTVRGTLGAPRDLSESIDRRVAYLKKQLTEAKIRANIRKVLRETE